ncbi:MAG: hypothetical protein F4X65_00720 [Chloroflexi bacterium]|nr:hypothetical protein [Chloroflexota bacterium]
MVTREELHNIIDFLPDSVLAAGGQVFLDFLKKEDPVLFALLTAPQDDEPETEEERAAVEEAYESIARGERMIPDAELAKELGL